MELCTAYDIMQCSVACSQEAVARCMELLVGDRAVPAAVVLHSLLNGCKQVSG